MKRNIQFVVLICVLLGFSTSVFAGYAKVTIRAYTTSNGYVSLSFDKFEDVGIANDVIKDKTSGYQSYSSQRTASITSYLQAKAQVGYYCVGWYDANSNSLKREGTQFQNDGKYDVGTWGNTAEYKESYYALFKPAEVTSPANGSTIVGATLEEPTGRAEHAQVRLSVKADRKSTRLNSSHSDRSRMPSSA